MSCLFCLRNRWIYNFKESHCDAHRRTDDVADVPARQRCGTTQKRPRSCYWSSTLVNFTQPVMRLLA